MKKPLTISQLMNYLKFCTFNMRHNANFIFSFIKFQVDLLKSINLSMLTV